MTMRIDGLELVEETRTPVRQVAVWMCKHQAVGDPCGVVTYQVGRNRYLVSRFWQRPGSIRQHQNLNEASTRREADVMFADLKEGTVSMYREIQSVKDRGAA